VFNQLWITPFHGYFTVQSLNLYSASLVLPWRQPIHECMQSTNQSEQSAFREQLSEAASFAAVLCSASMLYADQQSISLKTASLQAEQASSANVCDYAPLCSHQTRGWSDEGSGNFQQKLHLQLCRDLCVHVTYTCVGVTHVMGDDKMYMSSSRPM